MLKNLLVFALHLSPISFLHAMQGGGSMGDPIAPYYKPDVLFNQDHVLSQPEMRSILRQRGFTDDQLPENRTSRLRLRRYEQLPSYDLEQGGQQLEEAFEKEFFRRRAKLYRQAIGQETFAALVFPSLIGGAIAGEHATGIDAYIGGGFFDGIAAVNAMFLLIDGLKQVPKLIGTRCFPDNDPLVSYELEYARKKHAINFLDAKEDLQRLAQHKMISYPEQLFLLARRSTNELSSITKRIDTLLKIPTASRKPVASLDALHEWLALYEQDAQQKILRACVNHVHSYQTTLGINPSPRECLTLISRPGTGKSTCAEWMAESLGLPIATISLAGVDSQGLFGSGETPGLFLEKLGQIGVRNGIFFFDELDRAIETPNLLAILLPFLEPNAKKFYSSYVQRHIDVSHLFFVVAGNLGFQKEEALRSRFHPIKTAELLIADEGRMLDIVMNRYLPSRLHLGETPPKEAWRPILQRYAEELKKAENGYVSFRDVQNKIDELLADWRLEQHWGRNRVEFSLLLN